jgi:hypothetical protein
MKKLLPVFALVFVSMMVVFSCSGKNTITVKNESGTELIDMVIAEATEDAEWQEENNLFGDKTLVSGKSIEIPKTAFPKPGVYDLSFADANGTHFYYLWDVDTRITGSVTVTAEDREEGVDAEATE